MSLTPEITNWAILNKSQNNSCKLKCLPNYVSYIIQNCIYTIKLQLPIFFCD